MWSTRLQGFRAFPHFPLEWGVLARAAQLDGGLCPDNCSETVSLHFCRYPRVEQSTICVCSSTGARCFFFSSILCLRIHRCRSTPPMNDHRQSHVGSQMIAVPPQSSFVLFENAYQFGPRSLGKFNGVTKEHAHNPEQIDHLFWTVISKYHVVVCGSDGSQRIHRQILFFFDNSRALNSEC